jgi:hypothetical protein
LLIRIHGGKRRLAVLSLLKRRSAELLAVILSYKAPDSAAKPVSSSCCFSVITGYQRRVRLADQVEVPWGWVDPEVLNRKTGI